MPTGPLTDPDFWGVETALFSLMPMLAAIVLNGRRGDKPHPLALPLAALSCIAAIGGIYTTVIDGDPTRAIVIRVVGLAGAIIVLTLTVAQRRIAKTLHRRSG